MPRETPPGRLERRFVGAAVVVQVFESRRSEEPETDIPSAMGRQGVKRIEQGGDRHSQR